MYPNNQQLVLIMQKAGKPLENGSPKHAELGDNRGVESTEVGFAERMSMVRLIYLGSRTITQHFSLENVE